jgi:hypothetical protein
MAKHGKHGSAEAAEESSTGKFVLKSVLELVVASCAGQISGLFAGQKPLSFPRRPKNASQPQLEKPVCCCMHFQQYR